MNCVFPKKNRLTIIPILSGVFVIFLLFLPTFISASKLNVIGLDINKIQSSSFSELIRWLYWVLLIFSVGITFGVIIYGGIEYMTSAGNPKKMQSGINRIQDSAIGVLLIMISYLTLSTINPQLLFLRDPIITESTEGEIDISDTWPDLCFLFPGACEEGGSYPGGPVPIYPGGEPSENIDPNQTTPWGWPTIGRISSSYGWRCAWWDSGCGKYKNNASGCEGTSCWKHHNGIDIANECGTLIYATAKGIVVFAAEMGSYGNVIFIDHPNGHQTRYAHLSAFASNIKVGSEVFGGQNIGFMGRTGTATGCHLHYEIRFNDAPISPAPYLQN